MKWLWILAAILVLTVGGYWAMLPSLTLRYRLTLEAQVDGVLKSGSSVVQISYSKQSRFAGQSDLVADCRGEALVLQLGARGTLFGLLKEGSDSRSNPESIVFRAFDFLGGALPGDSVSDGLKQIGQLSGKRELLMTNLPLLVRFRDPNDPKTVESVDPLDIGKSFGAGTRLVSATLEMVSAGIWPLNQIGITGEPITAGIEKQLPWLTRITSNIDGTSSTSSSELSNVLHLGNFKRE